MTDREVQIKFLTTADTSGADQARAAMEGVQDTAKESGESSADQFNDGFRSGSGDWRDMLTAPLKDIPLAAKAAGAAAAAAIGYEIGQGIRGALERIQANGEFSLGALFNTEAFQASIAEFEESTKRSIEAVRKADEEYAKLFDRLNEKPSAMAEWLREQTQAVKDHNDALRDELKILDSLAKAREQQIKDRAADKKSDIEHDPSLSADEKKRLTAEAENEQDMALLAERERKRAEEEKRAEEALGAARAREHYARDAEARSKQEADQAMLAARQSPGDKDLDRADDEAVKNALKAREVARQREREATAAEDDLNALRTRNRIDSVSDTDSTVRGVKRRERDADTTGADAALKDTAGAMKDTADAEKQAASDLQSHLSDLATSLKDKNSTLAQGLQDLAQSLADGASEAELQQVQQAMQQLQSSNSEAFTQTASTIQTLVSVSRSHSEKMKELQAQIKALEATVKAIK